MDILTLREQVAESLRKQITDGEFAVGTVIPSAAVMAKQFGVSVPVVREALSDLRSQGLIASRQGAGTVVQSKQMSNGFRISPVHVRDRASLAELYAFRCDVESAAAEHAARRAKTADIKAIGAALAKLKANMLEPEQASADDIAFHTTIARTAGRYHLQLISYMTDEFSSAIGTARRNSAQWLGLTEKVQCEHEAIHDAIVARNPEAAKEAMRRHLTGAAKRLALSR